MPQSICSLPCRYILAVLGCFGLTVTFSLRVNLSVALVAMEDDFSWDQETRGIILGSFFYGYIVMLIPGGWLAERNGGKHFVGLGVLISSVLSLLTPLAARYSYKMLIVLRILEGLAQKHPTPWRQILTSRAVLAISISFFCSNWGFNTFLTSLPTYFQEVLHFNIEENGFLSALPYFCQFFTSLPAGFLADWLIHSHIITVTEVRKIFTLASCIMVALSFTNHPVVAVTLLCVLFMFQSIDTCGHWISPMEFAPRYCGLLFAIANSFATSTGIVAPFVVGYLTNNQGGCVHRVVAYTGWLRTQGGCVNRVVAYTGWLRTQGGCVHRVVAYTGWLRTQGGCLHRVVAYTGWLRTQGGCVHRVPTRDQWQKVYYIGAGIYVFGAVAFAALGTSKEQPWNTPPEDNLVSVDLPHEIRDSHGSRDLHGPRDHVGLRRKTRDYKTSQEKSFDDRDGSLVINA
ncbi:predicted protein [Nematostella vectensis]|uniref:Uncharacterized protein n=1 Tax=Nematostella vectensis TaxID=45351 RepID=A7RQG9_NEMVE|nr:predicted protein [Nematostella vectensis]|eukprot:XP_001638428.1 predicted protein [Nematostella vectensis]